MLFNHISRLAAFDVSSGVLDADPHPGESVSVLSVSPFEDDHRTLQSIFRHSNWSLSRAYGCEEAVDFVQHHSTPVVISEKDLAGQCWRNVLRLISSLNLQPVPRLIVSARLADDDLWSQVLNLGGYNVLEKPFDHREVFWVVSHAWLDWKSEWERSFHSGLSRLAHSAGV